jgi:hypothetical protein
MHRKGATAGNGINRRLGHQWLFPRFWDQQWLLFVSLRRGMQEALRRHSLPISCQRILDLGCRDRPYVPVFQDSIRDDNDSVYIMLFHKSRGRGRGPF